MTALGPLPASYSATRESLRVLGACFVVSPARKAATGRIGLRPVEGGFGTAAFGDDGRVVRVHGEDLVVETADGPVASAPITTLAAAADVVGVTLSADPGVGHDLPPFDPAATLDVDVDSSLALGGWYAFGAAVFAAVTDTLRSTGAVSDATIWPEHFDYAIDHDPEVGRRANYGFSPGDSTYADPYVYIGPWETWGVRGAFWNAPFGAVLPYAVLLTEDDPVAAAVAFFTKGHMLLTDLGVGTSVVRAVTSTKPD